MGTQAFENSVDQFLAADLVIHGWDLARATGQDDTIAPTDLAEMQEAVKHFPEEAMRSPGAFGPGSRWPTTPVTRTSSWGSSAASPEATCHHDRVEPNPLDAEVVCHSTTTGRSTGRPRGLEIWFTALGDSLYLISGGGAGADWVQYLRRPGGGRAVGDQTIPVIGRAPVHPGEERTVAVDHLFDKYGEQVTGTREDWHRTAFLVALDIRPHTR